MATLISCYNQCVLNYRGQEAFLVWAWCMPHLPYCLHHFLKVIGGKPVTWHLYLMNLLIAWVWMENSSRNLSPGNILTKSVQLPVVTYAMYQVHQLDFWPIKKECIKIFIQLDIFWCRINGCFTILTGSCILFSTSVFNSYFH